MKSPVSVPSPSSKEDLLSVILLSGLEDMLVWLFPVHSEYLKHCYLEIDQCQWYGLVCIFIWFYIGILVRFHLFWMTSYFTNFIICGNWNGNFRWGKKGINNSWICLCKNFECLDYLAFLNNGGKWFVFSGLK